VLLVLTDIMVMIPCACIVTWAYQDIIINQVQRLQLRAISHLKMEIFARSDTTALLEHRIQLPVRQALIKVQKVRIIRRNACHVRKIRININRLVQLASNVHPVAHHPKVPLLAVASVLIAHFNQLMAFVYVYLVMNLSIQICKFHRPVMVRKIVSPSCILDAERHRQGYLMEAVQIIPIAMVYVKMEEAFHRPLALASAIILQP
jgi:hypothetical protein